jgi:hypothetical protein
VVGFRRVHVNFVEFFGDHNPVSTAIKGLVLCLDIQDCIIHTHHVPGSLEMAVSCARDQNLLDFDIGPF